MPLEKAYIPYGAYWSTPFCRWQGSLGGLHAIELAARSARDFIAQRGLAPEGLDGVALGTTVPQRHGFYGAPWLAGMIGATAATGPTVAQACATSARLLVGAALEVEVGARRAVLAVACDRTSNGPHIYYPCPSGPGGRGESEDWVWDNFNLDPFAKNAMIETAEAVAREEGFSRAAQEELALLRHEQYRAALADDRAFQRRYMLPVEIPRGRGEVVRVEADEGARPPTAESLARMKPVVEGGSVTSGTQTFPADGNAGVIVTTRERAREIAPGAPEVQLIAWGEARVEAGRMPRAPVPAARRALEAAGVRLEDVAAVKTHNPFAVNDLWFCKETGVRPDAMNRFGCPLVWGHPQGPTGLRCLAELVEELHARGGGHGLFTGCAAGDTAMALVVRVG